MSEGIYIGVGVGAAWGFLTLVWKTVHYVLTRKNGSGGVCVVHKTLERRIERIEDKLDAGFTRVLDALPRKQ